MHKKIIKNNQKPLDKGIRGGGYNRSDNIVEKGEIMNQKKLASSFVLGTALAAGAVATTATAHAEEVTPTQPTTPSVETKATPVNTTAEDVNKAKTDLDNTQKLVDQNTDDLNKLGQKVDETKTNITNLEDDINKGKNAEPIIKTNQDIINNKTTEKTDVTNKLNDANRDNNDAKNDVENKKRDLDGATNDSNRAKNNVDKYNNITEPTPDEIKKNKDDITKLTNDEMRVNNDITNKEHILQDKKDTADRDRVRRADLVRDRDNTQRLVDTDTANRDRIDKEVKRLEKRLADGFPYSLTFNSTNEWNDLFKQYMNLRQENPPYDNDYKRLGDRYMAGEITDEQYTNERNALDVKSRQWTSDWFDRITAFEQKLMDAEWRLPATPDVNPPKEDQDETYDVTRISDLNDNLLLDLNQYFVNLLNTTQRTLGFNQGVKVNKNIINFAKDIAKEYEKEKFKIVDHFGRGINNVARKWGLTTSANPGVDTTVQFYENLMTSPRHGEFYGTKISKADLYQTVRDWLHGFFHEGLTAGKYGHAQSLVQAETLGLSFSYVDGILRMHVIQVKNPSNVNTDEDGNGLISETEDQKAKNIWNEKYSPNSKETLPVKDFSTNGVDVNHLTNLRTQVADLNNTIKTNQDKVDNFNRDIKTIDDRKDDVTNATNDLNKSKDELRDITTKKTDALNLERKLQDQITDARNKKQLRDDAVREYNRLEQIRKDKERDYNDALNRQKQTQKTVDDLTDQLKNLNDSINDATKKRDDAQRLKDQVPVLEKRLDDEKKKLDTLNKDVQDKKDDLEKSKKDLENKEKEYIKKKNLFELDKLLNIKKNKKDDIIFGIPKDAPTEDELPPAPLDMLPPKKDEVKPPKGDEIKPPKNGEIKPPKNGGVELLNNGGQTPRGGANRTGNNAGTGKALPNTGDNSRVARQLALGGYGLLASLGLAGFVVKRKRGE